MDAALAGYGDEFVRRGDGVGCDVRVGGRGGVEGGGWGVGDLALGSHGVEMGFWCAGLHTAFFCLFSLALLN